MGTHHRLRSSIGANSDPYWNRTVLLLSGNGTNGAQNNTFTDSSTNNFTITRNGNTTQGSFTPFSLPDGWWSNYFDGSGDYLTAGGQTAYQFGTGDFTIEFWIYFNSVSGQANILDFRGSAGTPAIAPVIYRLSSVIRFFTNGSDRITGSTTVTTGQWYHIALTRSGTSTKLFLNGTQEGSTYTDSNSYDIGTNAPSIGSSYTTNYVNGYISSLRLLKGTAQYTSNFTPPTSPLTAITNTSLLTCQSNRFIDNSINAFAITRNGDVAVQAFSPFASPNAYDSGRQGGSGYFDGSGDYLSVASNAAFGFGTGDFTVEGWCYISNTTGVKVLFDSRITSNTNGIAVYTSGTTIRAASGSTLLVSGGTLTANSWFHVALVRNGTGTNGTTLYLNGASVGSATLTTDFNTTSCYVANSYLNEYWNGYISSLRVLKGTAQYTSSFTPPTSPLTAITNTSLLLNFTNGGITDSAAKNDLETVGNAQVSTSVKKYGTGSLAFDGTGDWLLIRDNADLRFGTGDFTLECWLYLGATGSARGIVAKGTSTTGWLLSTNTSNQVVFTYGSSTITSTGALSGSTWYHLAVVRSGTGTNQVKIYIDGTNDGTGTVSTDFNQTNNAYVGADRTGGSAMNGNIADLRLTKFARYTANFTPPQQQLPSR